MGWQSVVGMLVAVGRDEKDREDPQGSGDTSPICCQRRAGLASASLPWALLQKMADFDDFTEAFKTKGFGGRW